MSGAASWIESARRRLDAARLLFYGGFYEDATSRAYFATFHAGKALLESRNHKAKSHNGVFVLLRLHFVRPGVLDDEWVRTMDDLRRLREGVDYKQVRMEKDEVPGYLSKAEALIDHVEALL